MGFNGFRYSNKHTQEYKSALQEARVDNQGLLSDRNISFFTDIENSEGGKGFLGFVMSFCVKNQMFWLSQK